MGSTVGDVVGINVSDTVGFELGIGVGSGVAIGLGCGVGETADTRWSRRLEKNMDIKNMKIFDILKC